MLGPLADAGQHPADRLERRSDRRRGWGRRRLVHAVRDHFLGVVPAAPVPVAVRARGRGGLAGGVLAVLGARAAHFPHPGARPPPAPHPPPPPLLPPARPASAP